MRFPAFACAAVLGLAAACSPVEPTQQQDVVIENTPGALVIDNPPRASFVEGNISLVEVRGHGATSALKINGNAAEVAPDGTFKATVSPKVGLNLVVAEDGASRLESPFLYGDFVSATRPVPRAIIVDIGPDGFSAAAPKESFTTVTNMVLAGRNLISMIKGQKFEGTAVGASWKFEVTGGQNGATVLSLAAGQRGPDIVATATDIVVEGILTVSALGIEVDGAVSMTVDRARLTGASELFVDENAGALKVAMPNADATLTGFRYNSGNAGFPCCVDSIMTSVLRGRVEGAIETGLREQVPNTLAVTLDGLGLPQQLDLTSIGFNRPFPIATRFDGAAFDVGGGTLSAQALFGGAFEPGMPGEKAPGWLRLGGKEETSRVRPATLGVSISVDAVNQLLFATWGSGALRFATTAPKEMNLTTNLPPVVSVSDNGILRLQLGELLAQRKSESVPFASINVLQDVAPTSEGDSVVLTPSGPSTISITWLTGGAPSGGNNAIADTVKSHIPNFLKPMKLPLARFSLDKLGGTFVGQSIALTAPAFKIDRETNRIYASGAMSSAK